MVLPKTNCLRQWRACFDLHQPQAWGLPSRLCLDGDCVRALPDTQLILTKVHDALREKATG
jgi:hypothetical protein